MRIAIDARLNAYRQGGIPQYTRQLLTALADVARDDHQFISLQHRDHLRPLAVAPNVARRMVLTPPHHRFESWSFPLEVLLARPDVLHCPDFIAPVHRPCPAVVTIHDLAFLHYPEMLEDSARAYYSQVKNNAARADAIIAVSEATRQDIAQFLDIPIEEIAVIHEAAAPLYGPVELRDGEARVLGSTPVAAETFMLFVSTLEPRKNLLTLLHALRICLDRRPDCPYRLVVAGSRGWRDEIIFQTARDLQLGDAVLFVGPVGPYDLRWLYNACRMYINPSLYEGFGLPLLEAMACGAPCLAAATSSLPEIGGAAPLYIPPLDAGLWADAIEALWDDQERRAELGRLSCAQAQRFSWTRAARETLNIYQRAVAHARRPAVPAYAPHSARQEAGAAAEIGAPVPADDRRACLRCGTPMLNSQLERGILKAEATIAQDDRSRAVLAWLCPRCGHVELVIAHEPPDVSAAPAAIDDAELSAPAALGDEPAVSDDQADQVDVAMPDENELGAPAALGDEIAAFDDQADQVDVPMLDESALGASVAETPDLAAELSAPDDEPVAFDDQADQVDVAMPNESELGASAAETPDLPAEAGSSDDSIRPPEDEPAHMALTQVFELPAELTPPCEADAIDGAEVPHGSRPLAEAAEPRQVAKPRARATINGTAPNHADPAEIADPAGAPDRARPPKKPRQPRSKRKRSS